MNPFLAEIRLFGFNFAPVGWALCNGQILPISQNTALFSLLGTTYGGDGKSTFALPNLQGHAPMHRGQGPGLSDRDLGEVSGSETVTLLATEIPIHTHQLSVANDNPELTSAKPGDGSAPGQRSLARNPLAPKQAPFVAMSAQSLAPAGGSQPHNNMMPYLVVNFCIALQGVFPQRP